MDFTSPMLQKRQTCVQRSQSKTLSQRIIDTFYAFADQVLLSDDKVELTGKECRQRLAHLKRSIELNVPPRGRVGVFCPNSSAGALSIFATILAGRVPVVLDHKVSTEILHKQWDQMNLHGAVLTSDLDLDIPLDVSIFRISYEGELLTVFGDPTFVMNPFPHPETAVILYTSGSAGEPKGVELPEEGLLYIIDYLIEYFDLDHTTVSAITLPLFHTMGLNTHFLPTFFAGGRSHFINNESIVSFNGVYRAITETEGSFVSLITDFLRVCYEEKIRRNVKPAKKVKVLQLAGGHIRPEHIKVAKELFPGARIVKGYGLTEAIRVSMIDSRDKLFVSDTAGFVLPGQEIRIKNTDTGDVLAPGVIGEIFVKGPNVMLGYDLDSRSRFDEDGFLGTGDLGFLTHDGHLVIRGRKDSVFKSNGRLISAREIEMVALEMPNICEVKCLPVPTSRGLKPILFVETKVSNEEFLVGLDRNDLELFLKKKLEPHKLPRDIIVLSMLPRTANGKIDQRMLLETWQKVSGNVSTGTFSDVVQGNEPEGVR